MGNSSNEIQEKILIFDTIKTTMRNESQRNYNDIIWISIPMYMYKIEIVSSKDVLNFLDLTILKFLSINVTDTDWLSENLCLSPPLIDAIIDNLIYYNYIDEKLKITDTALQLLDSGNKKQNKQNAFIFYNIFKETFEDYVLEDKDIERFLYKGALNNNLKDVLSINISKKANTENFINSILIKPLDNYIPVIDQDNAYDCWKKYQNSISNSEVDSDPDADVSYLEDLPTVTDDIGELVYVSTCLFYPKDQLVEFEDLEAKNPFFKDIIDTELSYALLKSLSKINALHKRLNILVANKNVLSFDEIEDHKANYSNDTSQDNKKYSDNFVDVFSKNILNYPNILKSLIDSKKYSEQLHYLESSTSTKRNDYQQTEERYILECYNLLSLLLIEISISDYIFKGSFLTNDVEQNAESLTHLAKSINFHDTSNEFLQYFKLEKNKILSATKGQSEMLSALICYNIISASCDNTHPFYDLSKNMPDFINHAWELIYIRNHIAHGNGSNYPLYEIKHFFEFNMFFSSILIKDLTFDIGKKEFDNFSEQEHKKFLTTNKKLLDTTKNNLVNDYPLINNFPTLINNLTYVEFAMTMKDKSFILYVSNVFESLFLQLYKFRLETSSIKYLDNISEKEDLFTFVSDNGFNCTSLPFASQTKILKTFKYKTSYTLNTLFYCWLFSEIYKKEVSTSNDFFEEFVEQLNDLPAFIEDISKCRKHTGRLDFSSSDLHNIKNDFTNYVNTFLTLMDKYNFYS